MFKNNTRGENDMNKTAYDLLEKDPRTQDMLARCIKNMKKVTI